jgi:hypothetical protein
MATTHSAATDDTATDRSVQEHDDPVNPSGLTSVIDVEHVENGGNGKNLTSLRNMMRTSTVLAAAGRREGGQTHLSLPPDPVRA